MKSETGCNSSHDPAVHVSSTQAVLRCHGFPSRERFEQRLGLLEVGGVKALGEPAVDLGQEL
jgi:hypothetical protein